MKSSTEYQVSCIAPIRSRIYKTVKRKLNMGTKIVEDVEESAEQNNFRQLFSVEEEEKLLNVSRCSLPTTAGPIAGQLFVSTEKLAFCSETSHVFTSSSGESIETLYKVVIPVKKMERASKSENMKRSTEKYIEIVTVDNFDFWFMDIVNHQKTFKCIQQVIHKKNG